MKRWNFVSGLCLIFLIGINICFAQDIQDKPQELAGEFFGMPVPAGNYYFAKRVVMTFNASWRGIPRDEKELEDLVWQELLFSYEAFKRGITAKEEEIDEEIDKMLKAEKAEFKWRIDKEAFQNWVKEKLGAPVELFRNQMAHLVTLEKLRKQIIDSFVPEVSEKEAYQKFLDEYNSLSVELVQFDDLSEAKKFYEQATQPLTAGALEELIWEDLILSDAAAKRKIEVQPDEVDVVMEKLLREEKVNFRWKEDKENFKKWIEEKIGISEEFFRKCLRQLTMIDKLRQKIEAKEEPEINTLEVYQKLLTDAGTVEAAYSKFFEALTTPADDILRFNNLNEAGQFYKKIKRRPGSWDEKKRKEPKLFKQPGFVALDFLINMWGFKREDSYKMMDKEAGAFYPPAPIYKGYGVFKILEIRKADDAEFAKRKDYYFDRVKMIKKYDLYKEWVEELKKKANIKVYIK